MDTSTPLLKLRRGSLTPPGLAIAYPKMTAICTSSCVNILLVFVPLGFVAYYLSWPPIAIFTLNFFAIVPLAALLSYATEEISEHVGETVGGLLNATFGNAVELIVAIVALFRGEIRIVQTSMLGSILSNILLVMGCCFIAGGYNRVQQKFNITVAQTMASMMALSVSSLLIPAAYNAGYPHEFPHVLAVSRGTSIVLLVVYILYLLFQLRTHSDYFEAQNEQTARDPFEDSSILETAMGNNDMSYTQLQSEQPMFSPTSGTTSGTSMSASAAAARRAATQLSTLESLALIAVVTVIVAFCADFLVDSIDSIVSTTGISKTFIGIILIPIVGNAAEHSTAVISAVKNKMDLAVGVAIGSSMQIALFMTPFLVILGWIVGQPMSLLFSTFETCVLFIAVMIMNYIVNDGESNWLEGAMLLSTYVIISIAFYYTP